MDKLVILSGCSGGGKSTLLSELSKRGCATVEEPGRRVVEQQLKAGGTALPWVDLKAFLHQAVAIAEQDYAAAREKSDFSIFDRSLIDAASALRNWATTTGTIGCAMNFATPRSSSSHPLGPKST